MLISEVIQAPPGVAPVYYHGTYRVENARRIAAEGLVPGDISGQTNPHGNGDYTDKFVPVTGMVYLTPDLCYAVGYALWSKRPGMPMPDKAIQENGRYGFIFVVPGDRLTLVQPDEDDAGGAAWEAAAILSGEAWPHTRLDNVSLGTALRNDINFCRDLDALARKALGKKAYAVIANPQSLLPDIATAGRKLVAKMPDRIKARLIAMGCHVAHQGPVMPTEVWRLDKTRNPEIGYNAEKFFEVAERLPLNHL